MFGGCAIKQETDSNNKCNGRKGAKSNLYASMHFADFVFSFYCMMVTSISLPQSNVPAQNRRFLWRCLLRTVHIAYCSYCVLFILRTVHITGYEASVSEVT